VHHVVIRFESLWAATPATAKPLDEFSVLPTHLRTDRACATSAIKEVEEPTFCGRFLGSCGVNYHQAPPGPRFIAIERARAKWGSLRLACFDLSDGPGSTEHTAEAFAGSDIVGPPLKANENWDGRMVRCLFLSEVVALRRGYSVK
jgi:hypothetical protein